ncbi:MULTISPECIES: glycosyltransferase [unclassified Curtobacterium]|uniref:glycosyltransferase n=1 Tax=unclassified Curtobacterium TaxID=257496 RepID=UPI000A025E91|nr:MULTISPECIES: glycosyltransferase [unclassified Curtobacterium]
MTTDRLPVVAFLSHSAALSGAELLVARVTAACTRIEPIVVLGEHGPLEELLAASGVRCQVVPLDASVRHHTAATGAGLIEKTVSTLRATHELTRVLGTLGVDVLTTHSAKAHIWGGLAGRRAGIPVVAHAHDLVGADGSSRVNAALLRLAFALLPRTVIANSRSTARSLGRLPRPVAVVGCPVSVPAEAAPHTASAFTIGMVGRLTPWKGQGVVLRAFAAARAAGLDPDARLRLVGAPLFGADDAFARALHTLASDLGVRDSVDFRGHQHDVAAEMAACDVVVHASTRAEPFGQVVIEAMALGRAVIASDAGGPAEIITDDRDGLLVSPGDVAALASAMVRLAADREARGRLADNGRRIARRFDLPRVVAQIEAVLVATAR